jgi:hypothetical protein
MFHFTKSSLSLYLSIILVTGSLLQISSTTNFFGNNAHILVKIHSIYAQYNGGNGNGGNGDGGDDNGVDSDGGDGIEDHGDFAVNGGNVSDDSGESDNVEELTLDEDAEVDDVGQAGGPEELTFSEDKTSKVLTLDQQDTENIPKEPTLKKEGDFLSEENVDKSYEYQGENETTETEEEREFEEREYIAEIEDDLEDAKTPEEKDRIGKELEAAKKKFNDGKKDKRDRHDDKDEIRIIKKILYNT